MRVLVSAPLHPTERPELVREALARLFPEAELREEPGRVAGEGGDLRPLRRRVWELRIIDTFRGKFLHGVAADGRSVRFRLSKQAALQGKVSFPPGAHVLGDLEVEVRLEDGDPFRDAEQLAWWLCPETKEGEIVGPKLD